MKDNFNSVLYCVIIVIAILFKQGAAQDITFMKTIGSPADDVGYSVQPIADGGYILCGWTYKSAESNSDVYLVRFNSFGDTLWTKTFGGVYNDRGLSIGLTSDNGYIITGDYEHLGSETKDIYLIRTDSNGDTLWTKTFGGTFNDIGRSVQQTSDGGFIIAGESFILGPQLTNAYMIKTDADGNEQWSNNFGRFSGFNDYSYSVQQTLDGGYVLAGYSQATTGFYDVYLVKTDANGDSAWTKTYGGVSFDFGLSVQETSDNGFIIAGSSLSFGPFPENVYLIKTDAAGDILWSKTIGGSNSEIGYSVKQTTDGGYIVTGVTTDLSSGDNDVYLVKTDANGDSVWTKTFGGNGNEQGYEVNQTADNGFIITGQANSFGTGGSDVFLIKTDSDGNLLTVGLDNSAKHIPQAISLFQNYPNPFNPKTSIAFSIPITSDVLLKIYDLTGREIDELVNGTLTAGEYTVDWHAQHLPSGVYLYRLTAGEFSQTRKLTLLK